MWINAITIDTHWLAKFPTWIITMGHVKYRVDPIDYAHCCICTNLAHIFRASGLLYWDGNNNTMVIDKCPQTEYHMFYFEFLANLHLLSSHGDGMLNRMYTWDNILYYVTIVCNSCTLNPACETVSLILTSSISQESLSHTDPSLFSFIKVPIINPLVFRSAV